MSAPNTNLAKQRKRHIGPLVGIAVAVSVAAVLLFFYTVYVGSNEPPDAAETSAPTNQPLPAGSTPSTSMSDPSSAPQTIDDTETPGSATPVPGN